jgi:hypothetical protein
MSRPNLRYRNPIFSAHISSCELTSPLPYGDHEADFEFILVLPSFEHLTKQFPPFGYVSLRSKLL